MNWSEFVLSGQGVKRRYAFKAFGSWERRSDGNPVYIVQAYRRIGSGTRWAHAAMCGPSDWDLLASGELEEQIHLILSLEWMAAGRAFVGQWYEV